GLKRPGGGHDGAGRGLDWALAGDLRVVAKALLIPEGRAGQHQQRTASRQGRTPRAGPVASLVGAVEGCLRARGAVGIVDLEALDEEAGMRDARCGVWDVGCGMRDARCEAAWRRRARACA